MKLFCIPYAGGSETIFYSWRKYLGHSIELVPIQLKGRGRRFSESLYKSVEEAVDDIFVNIKDKIVDDDFCIYGHSMGSLLAYELYYKLSDGDFKLPKHIFFSGHKAPSKMLHNRTILELSDNDFINYITKFGGMSEEILDYQELLQIFLPVIKNDIRILDNYNYEEKLARINCDVSIFYGKKDDISMEDILAWKNHVCKSIELYSFEGNHFFINDNIEYITNIISTILERY
ncbi:thioesterase II family protein [Lacrimispora algidixylanolytica]|nr:thioesterase domain-containing protein [Lacrimispora algidixylanolytica]